VVRESGQCILNKKDEINSAIDEGSFNFGVNTASEFDMGYCPANVLTAHCPSSARCPTPP
jgi:hypothetical protein